MSSWTKTTAEQIDVWRATKSEDEHLEFKEAKNQFDFNELLAYCVALANEHGGSLLLGIANKPPRPVVGTKAFPNVVKTTEDIFNNLHFRVDVEQVQHPNGRVLVFHVPSRPIGHAYELRGSYYMRSGESLVAMSPDQLKRIFYEGTGQPEVKQEKKGSNRREAIVAIVGLILVFSLLAFLWSRFLDTMHKAEHQTVEIKPTETHPATDKPTAAVKQSEQTSKNAVHDSTRPGSKNIPGNGPVDWHDKYNWRKYLRVGMTRKEVHNLFGEAEKIRVFSDLETWQYGSGEITFVVEASSPDGSLYSWDEPR